MTPDPKKIIDTANGFFLASERSREQRPLADGKIQMLLVPAIVSAAFAIELYFKAILLLEGGAAKGHDLAKLFSQLSSKAQSEIVAVVQLPPTNFNKKLCAVADVFVEWRYIYEQSAAHVDLDFLQSLAISCRALAATRLATASP